MLIWSFDELEYLSRNGPFAIQAQLNWLALYDEIEQWVKQDKEGIFEITSMQDSLKQKTICDPPEPCHYRFLSAPPH